MIKELLHPNQLCCGRGYLPSEVLEAELIAAIRSCPDQFVIGRN